MAGRKKSGDLRPLDMAETIMTSAEAMEAAALPRARVAPACDDLPPTAEMLPLPAGISLADYPVVDISAEPYDGDPTHSTDSVVRGTLPA